jgi:chromosome segregation ATPase
MADVRATTIAQWHELADARQEEIVDLRKRLVVVEACLEDTRAQLRKAQARVWVLETERVSLLARIDELEGKKQTVEGKA